MSYGRFLFLTLSKQNIRISLFPFQVKKQYLFFLFNHQKDNDRGYLFLGKKKIASLLLPLYHFFIFLIFYPYFPKQKQQSYHIWKYQCQYHRIRKFDNRIQCNCSTQDSKDQKDDLERQVHCLTFTK